ncbi:MAG: hypothetical protein Q8P11_00425 [bacterium]|nr:hypothetical protein [bacterium]
MKKIEELHGMNSKSYRVELENKCKEYFSFLSSTHGEVHQTIYFGKVIRSDLGREYLVAVKKLLGDLRWEQDRVQRTYRHLLSTKSVTDLVTV